MESSLAFDFSKMLEEIQRLRELMARLQAGWMSWDQEQTHQSIARCLVEEAAEVLEAIDTENTNC